MALSLQTSMQVHGAVRECAQPAGSIKITLVTNRVADTTTRLPLDPLCFYSGVQLHVGISRLKKLHLAPQYEMEDFYIPMHS